MSDYLATLSRVHGVGGGTAYPAPGSNGPAQMLYNNHATYQNANNGPVTEGSDSWPGSQNPTTQETRP
jgi:hypothetical protein